MTTVPRPSPGGRNPYRVLGLAPTAGKDEIKAAYRELARKNHPDHHPDDPQGAAERLKQITAAHETLSDSARRKACDAPWMRLRIPRGLTPGAPPPQRGLFARLLGLRPPDGPGSLHFVYLDAGITCFRHEGLQLVAQAEVEFRRALEARPASREARFDLALACYWLGRFDEARALLDEVARLEPEDATARHMADSLD